MSPQPDYGMPVHPVCDLFPLMDPDSLSRLATDIKANGLLIPVVLHEGQIVDGRNRVLACRSAGIEPHFVQWRDAYPGAMPVERWIWSLNVERRHLTQDQIAWAIVQRRAWELKKAALLAQIEAGKQQAERGKEGGRGHKKPLPQGAGEGVSPPRRDRSRETDMVLAKEAGVSRNKIDQALAIQKLADDQKVGPDVSEQLRQGTVKLHEVLKAGRPPVPAAAVPPPAPASAPERAGNNTAASRHDPVAKRRMIAALAQIRGHCRGLSELDASAIRHVCSAEEIATWAEIARNAAKELRLFSRKLACAQENK